jgi:arylformamidase
MEKQNYQMVDLSHTIKNGLITYPGLPAPVITAHLGREASRSHYTGGTEFHIGKIEMVANTGTYLDSPFHRYPEGKDLSQIPLTWLANLDGVVVRVVKRTSRAIEWQAFDGFELQGKAVLVHTGWDVFWETDRYFGEHPFLTRKAAEYLANAQVAVVGIDSLNIDNTADGSRPVHSILLGKDIPVVEHLCNLGKVPNAGFKFFAVPVKIKDFGTFPVRAFALVESTT